MGQSAPFIGHKKRDRTGKLPTDTKGTRSSLKPSSSADSSDLEDSYTSNTNGNSQLPVLQPYTPLEKLVDTTLMTMRSSGDSNSATPTRKSWSSGSGPGVIHIPSLHRDIFPLHLFYRRKSGDYGFLPSPPILSTGTAAMDNFSSDSDEEDGTYGVYYDAMEDQSTTTTNLDFNRSNNHTCMDKKRPPSVAVPQKPSVSISTQAPSTTTASLSQNNLPPQKLIISLPPTVSRSKNSPPPQKFDTWTSATTKTSSASVASLPKNNPPPQKFDILTSATTKTSSASVAFPPKNSPPPQTISTSSSTTSTTYPKAPESCSKNKYPPQRPNVSSNSTASIPSSTSSFSKNMPPPPATKNPISKPATKRRTSNQPSTTAEQKQDYLPSSTGRKILPLPTRFRKKQIQQSPNTPPPAVSSDPSPSPQQPEMTPLVAEFKTLSIQSQEKKDIKVDTAVTETTTNTNNTENACNIVCNKSTSLEAITEKDNNKLSKEIQPPSTSNIYHAPQPKSPLPYQKKKNNGKSYVQSPTAPLTKVDTGKLPKDPDDILYYLAGGQQQQQPIAEGSKRRKTRRRTKNNNNENNNDTLGLVNMPKTLDDDTWVCLFCQFQIFQHGWMNAQREETTRKREKKKKKQPTRSNNQNKTTNRGGMSRSLVKKSEKKSM